MSARPNFRTDPDHVRAELRGRTYAVPFDRVWDAAGAVIASLRGWTLLEADDRAGWMTIRAEGWPFKATAELRVTVKLDENAQTRVDLVSVPEKGSGGVGAARRRVIRFFRGLDAAVDAEGRHTLDVRSSAGRETAG